MKTFKALESVKSEEGNKTSIIEKSISDLPEGDLLIKVNYSSLNYKDALSASGSPGVTRNYPHTPGIDAVGIIEESNNPSFKEGDSVIVTGYDLGMNTAGGFGQYIRVPSSWAIPLPAGLGEKDSMCLGTAGLTAGLSVFALDKHNSQQGFDGTSSIVSGSTGGVGSIALMLLSKLGSNVTAITGKDSQEELLKNLGVQPSKDLKTYLVTRSKMPAPHHWQSHHYFDHQFHPPKLLLPLSFDRDNRHLLPTQLRQTG